MKLIKYFTKTERIIWCLSVLLVISSFCVFDGKSILTLGASLIGVSAIILNAKGNPIGQLLMVIFSFAYGIISYSFAYWGEMITYLGMTMPMAIAALCSWIKNPYKGKKTEVAVGHLKKGEHLFALALTVVVTCIFHFILDAFNTPFLFFSTLSVSTSFLAVYLTFRRSPYFSVLYAANDVVLIILWTLASFHNTEYISVIICFLAFLVNDIYAFLNWRRIENRQRSNL